MTIPPISHKRCAPEHPQATLLSRQLLAPKNVDSPLIIGDCAEDEEIAQLLKENKIDEQCLINFKQCQVPRSFLIPHCSVLNLRTFFLTPFPIIGYLNNALKREIKCELAKFPSTPFLTEFVSLPLLKEDPEDHIGILRTSILPAQYFLKLCRRMKCTHLKLFGGEGRRALILTFIEMLQQAFQRPLNLTKERIEKKLHKRPDWDIMIPFEGASFEDLQNIKEDIIKDMCEAIFGNQNPDHFRNYCHVIRKVLCRTTENFGGETFSTGASFSNGIDDKIDLNFTMKHTHDDAFSIYTPSLWIPTALLEFWLANPRVTALEEEKHQLSLGTENSPHDNCLQSAFDIVFDILRFSLETHLNSKIFVRTVAYVSHGMRSFTPGVLDRFLVSLNGYEKELHVTLSELVLDWHHNHGYGDYRALIAMAVNMSIVLHNTHPEQLQKFLKTIERAYLKEIEDAESKQVWELIALAIKENVPVAIILSLLQSCSFISLFSSSSKMSLREHEKRPVIEICDCFSIFLPFAPLESFQLLLAKFKESEVNPALEKLAVFLLNPVVFDCDAKTPFKRNRQQLSMDTKRLTDCAFQMLDCSEMLLQNLGYRLLLALQTVQQDAESLLYLLRFLPQIVHLESKLPGWGINALTNYEHFLAKSPFKFLAEPNGVLNNARTIISSNHISPQQFRFEWILLLASTADPKLISIAISSWHHLKEEFPVAERFAARNQLVPFVITVEALQALKLFTGTEERGWTEDWQLLGKTLRACRQQSPNGAFASVCVQAFEQFLEVPQPSQNDVVIPIVDIMWAVQEIIKAYPEKLAEMIGDLLQRHLLDRKHATTISLVMLALRTLLKKSGDGYLEALLLWNHPVIQDCLASPTSEVDSFKEFYLRSLCGRLTEHFHPNTTDVKLELLKMEIETDKNPELFQQLLTLWSLTNQQQRLAILGLGDAIVRHSLACLKARNETERKVKPAQIHLDIVFYALGLLEKLGKIQCSKTQVMHTFELLVKLLEDGWWDTHPLPHPLSMHVANSRHQMLLHLMRVSLFPEVITYLRLLEKRQFSFPETELEIQMVLRSIQAILLGDQRNSAQIIQDCDHVFSLLKFHDLNPPTGVLRRNVIVQLIFRLLNPDFISSQPQFTDRALHWIHNACALDIKLPEMEGWLNLLMERRDKRTLGIMASFVSFDPINRREAAVRLYWHIIQNRINPSTAYHVLLEQHVLLSQYYSSEDMAKAAAMLIPEIPAFPSDQQLNEITPLLQNYPIAEGSVWVFFLEKIASSNSLELQYDAWKLFELSVKRHSYSGLSAFYEKACISALTALRTAKAPVFFELIQRSQQLLAPCTLSSDSYFKILQLLLQGSVDNLQKMQTPCLLEAKIQELIEWHGQLDPLLTEERAAPFRIEMDSILINTCLSSGSRELFMKGVDFIIRAAPRSLKEVANRWLKNSLIALTSTKYNRKREEIFIAYCHTLEGSLEANLNPFPLIRACIGHSSEQVSRAGCQLFRSLLNTPPKDESLEVKSNAYTQLSQLIRSANPLYGEILQLPTLSLWLEQKQLSHLWEEALRRLFEISSSNVLTVFRDHFARTRLNGEHTSSPSWLALGLDYLIKKVDEDHDIQRFHDGINLLLQTLTAADFKGINESLPNLDLKIANPAQEKSGAQEKRVMKGCSVDRVTHMIFFLDPTLLPEFCLESKEESLKMLHLSSKFKSELSTTNDSAHVPMVSMNVSFYKLNGAENRKLYMQYSKTLVTRLCQIRTENRHLRCYITNLLAQYLLFLMEHYPEFPDEILGMIDIYFFSHTFVDRQNQEHLKNSELARLDQLVFQDHVRWCTYILELMTDIQSWNVKSRYRDLYFALSLCIEPEKTPNIDFFHEKAIISYAVIHRLINASSSIFTKRALDILKTHQIFAGYNTEQIRKTYLKLIQACAKDPFYPFFQKQKVHITKEGTPESEANGIFVKEVEKFLLTLKKPLHSFLPMALLENQSLAGFERHHMLGLLSALKNENPTEWCKISTELCFSYLSLLFDLAKKPDSPQDTLLIAMKFLGASIDNKCFLNNTDTYLSAVKNLMPIVITKLDKSSEKVATLERYDLFQFFSSDIQVTLQESRQRASLFVEWIQALLKITDAPLLEEIKCKTSKIIAQDMFCECLPQLKELGKAFHLTVQRT